MPKAQILVVEDDDMIAQSIQSSLEYLEYETTGVVPYAEKAVEMVQENAPDLVLMDITLKGEMNGIEAAEIIQSRFDVPVVFLSAHTEEEKIAQAKLAMPYGYILKPFKIKDLKITIEMALFAAKANANRKKAQALLEKALNELELKVKERTDDLSTMNIKLQQEIDERKKIEKTLRESEERYRLLADNATDVIWTSDMNLKFTYISPSVRAQQGHTVEEALNRTLEESLTPSSFKLAQAVLAEELEIEKSNQKDTQKSRTIEVEINCKDGSTIAAEIKTSFLRDWKEKPIGFIGITRDITQRKRLEAQLQHAQKMESIGTLAGGVAHDFNNILGIVLGNAELAMDDVPEWNPVRINLEEIRTASLRAKDVVRQLLSFARKAQVKKQPTNITPIIKESLKLLRSSIPTSIEFVQNIKKDADTILADPTQIHQVLINLFTNANHAMPDGGLIVTTLKNVKFDEDSAAQHPDLSPGRYVNLAVRDTGQGIPHDVIDRIFDPYFTTKDVGKGTGMGLAVVHGIVQGHNGLITVESEIGNGTTFNIFFPVVEEEIGVETKNDKTPPAGNVRILFIDDEESIVKLVSQRLERLGYKVEAKTSPIEALELFRSRPDQFDLVITDLTMPKMTGDMLVKNILDIRPELPILLCTGFSDKIDKAKSRGIGAVGYIEKPLETHDLAQVVREILNGK